MSVRTKMLGFVDVILRVPPIFIIDEILKIGMGIPFTPHHTVIDTTKSSSEMLVDDVNATNASSADHLMRNDSSPTDLFGAPNLTDDIEFYQILSMTSLKFFSCLLGKC